MKEFIKHPAVTRIFAREIDRLNIKSITLDDNDEFNLVQLDGSQWPTMELYNEIKHAARTAKYEDEAAKYPHEETDTITAAIESRKNR